MVECILIELLPRLISSYGLWLILNQQQIAECVVLSNLMDIFNIIFTDDVSIPKPCVNLTTILSEMNTLIMCNLRQ